MDRALGGGDSDELKAAIENFTVQYPLDESAVKYLLGSPEDVQWAVLKDFKPKNEGEQDYSALLISFTKRLRSQGQRGMGHPGPQGLDLEGFMQQYPMDEAAQKYILASPPEVQQAVLETFKPKREGDQDYSAIIISFTKRKRQEMGGGFMQQQLPHGAHPADIGAPWRAASSSGPMTRLGGPNLQMEVERFVQRYPLDEAAHRYLVNSSADAQWMILKNFKPQREGEHDYSALLISFAKNQRMGDQQRRIQEASMQQEQQRQQQQAIMQQQMFMQQQMMMQQQRPQVSQASMNRLKKEMERFLQRYPCDESAQKYLKSSSPDVQWRVFEDFTPKQEGEGDYSALLISFTKRAREQSGNAPRQESGARLRSEIEQFKAQYPLDEGACKFLDGSPSEVKWAVLHEFAPKNEGESDYSALLIGFAKRLRANIGQSSPMRQPAFQPQFMPQAGPMMRSPVFQQQPSPRMPPRGAGRGPVDPSMVPPHVSEFCSLFPIDEEALNYVLASPQGVQEDIIANFSPPRAGEADYSALVISFAKRCRSKASSTGFPMSMPAPQMREDMRPPRGAPHPDLMAFRAMYPMDDRAFQYLAESPSEVQEGVMATFQPKRHNDTDYSAPVVAYAKMLRSRGGSAPMGNTGGRGHAGPAFAGGGAGFGLERQIGDFCRQYPVDSNCLQLLLSLDPGIADRVLRDFRAKREGEADYSAAVVTFVSMCKRGAAGSQGGFGPLPKRPRMF